VPPAAPDREKLVRLTTVMEGLTVKVGENTKEMAEFRQQLADIERDGLGELKTSVAVQKEKIGRLEKIVYGLAGAVVIELLGIIGAIIVWAVTSHH
jgi:hypothetical protein